MFAIIRTGGKQYKVSPGQVITIEKLPIAEGSVDFSDVLLVGGDQTLIGTPLVPDAAVKAEVVRELRGEKIKVFKYQAKSHWNRTKGHRQDLTQVRIKDIVTQKEKVKTAKDTKEEQVKS